MVFSTTSMPRVASSSAAESHAPAPTRPYIPPLEDSFEQAWERGKFTSPTDSPHLSRAAAGGIIAIALAVILGALVYNFRQDIGEIVVQLGQSISGENRPAVPAPAQETKPETSPPEQQPRAQAPQPAGSQPTGSQAQNASAESGNAANPAISADTNPSTGSATGGAAPTGKPRNSVRAAVPPVVPPVENPPEDSTVGAVDPAAKSGAAADSVIGQEEFTAARDILRGSNRQRDLYRAVILLWASVKKGHVPAEVTLADLYRRGEGVEKNCDQARVLLVAASKKGSIEARQMMEQIAERGCQ
jgi:hypothetical protein